MELDYYTITISATREAEIMIIMTNGQQWDLQELISWLNEKTEKLEEIERIIKL